MQLNSQSEYPYRGADAGFFRLPGSRGTGGHPGLDVFAQNIETVERLTHVVRDPRAGISLRPSTYSLTPSRYLLRY